MPEYCRIDANDPSRKSSSARMGASGRLQFPPPGRRRIRGSSAPDTSRIDISVRDNVIDLAARSADIPPCQLGRTRRRAISGALRPSRRYWTLIRTLV
jgi:hypothetical protein